MFWTSGVTTTQAFDPNTGLVQSILAGVSNGVSNQTFAFDSLGRLTSRTWLNNAGAGVKENSCFDGLNRLTSTLVTSGAACAGAGAVTLTYDTLGAITSKSDICATAGCFAHGSGAGPHALAPIIGTYNGVVKPTFAYDANGTMTSGAGRTVTSTSFNMAASIVDGSRIRLSGEGDSGARGGPRGDLYIFVSVRPHELFERDGLDLLCTVPVPMATACLGGEIEAPCLLGGENCDGQCRIKVKVPEGAQPGQTVRLRGKGMPSLRTRQRGDLVVQLEVETPTRLTAKQKALMREFAALYDEQQNPRSANFFLKAKRFWSDVTGAEGRV